MCVCHGYQFCSDILLSKTAWATEGTNLVSYGVLHTSRFQGIIRHLLFLVVSCLFICLLFCLVCPVCSRSYHHERNMEPALNTSALHQTVSQVCTLTSSRQAKAIVDGVFVSVGFLLAHYHPSEWCVHNRSIRAQDIHTWVVPVGSRI